MYHIPLTFQCKYGRNDEGDENGDREEGSEFSGGRKIVKIAWPLVCR